MKKSHVFGVFALVLLAALLVFLPERAGSRPIGEQVSVITFTSGGQPTGKILLQVPFLHALRAGADMSIAVDTDVDGLFSDDEMLVSGAPIASRDNWNSGYYALSNIPITDEMQALVAIGDTEYRSRVSVKTVEVGELLDLASVTDPENATKGWSIAEAEEVVEVSQEGVPDLTQRKGECAPTAAANSLISLVAKNGGEDLIPGDPLDFIENLKRHMNWTPENGVPPDDFVAGKNRWAAAAGVPIRTTKVGDAHGLSTIDSIRDALQNGGAVELRIKFADAEGNAAGGHMVTVTGIHQREGQTYLDINDPATPDSGTETVEVRGNTLVNYGPWSGTTILSWGFVQIWEGHPTGELLDPMTDEEIQGIRQFVGDEPMITVIEYNGKYLPVSQLVVESEEGCGADHWHAARGVVTATDGTNVPDPGPQCGYGTVKDKPSMNIPAPERNTIDADAAIEVRGLESLKTQ